MNCLKLTVLLFTILSLTGASFAQNEPNKLTGTILADDESFWTGYNACNYDLMSKYVADDVEFYHDKGGITLGKIDLIESIRKNLCSNPTFHTRREAVAGTVKVYLLKSSQMTYGALIEGDHYFYNSYNGKPEIREGLAKFTSLWILKDGTWKMTRILSYDHHEAPYLNARKEISLNKKELNKFAGEYSGTQSGSIKVSVENNLLRLLVGKNKYALYSETKNLFFVKERDLTFEFVAQDGNIARIVIREKGATVEEVKKIN